MTDDRLAEIKGTTYYVADVIVGDINWLVGEIERLRVQWMAEQRDNERLRAEILATHGEIVFASDGSGVTGCERCGLDEIEAQGERCAAP